MDNIELLENITKKYLLKYENNFNKLYENLVNGGDSIKNEYFKGDKYAESWPLQSIYSDYDFLSNLDKIEKDKYIFMYSIFIYIHYIREIENMKIGKDYLSYIKFDLDKDFFNDQGELLFPYFNYYIANNSEGKIKKIEWNKGVSFKKYWPEGRKYMENIVKDLGLTDYLNVSDSYLNTGCSEDYNVNIDFNFDISGNKKILKNFFKHI